MTESETRHEMQTESSKPNRNRPQKSFTLSNEALDMLGELSASNGLSHSANVETAIRQAHTRLKAEERRTEQDKTRPKR